MLDGSVPMPLMESIVLSIIGIFIVFLELSILAGIIVLISKIMRKITKEKVAPTAKKTPVTNTAPPSAVAVPVATAPHGLTLVDVDEPTAATVMAVVSHQTGIPLNRLDFHSIKGVVSLVDVSERDAAVLMALVADKLNKPINRLNFKSITQVK